MTIKQFSLAYKDGSSDKVYHAQIEQKDNGYIVNFQYGKRNSTLAVGCKTPSPVTLEAAEKIYNTLRKEKEAKGYSEGESGAIFQAQDINERKTGIYPQLPLAFDGEENDLEEHFDSSDWIMQEKMDGWRTMTQKIGTKVTPINKKGLSTVMPQIIEDQLNVLKEDAIFDGELIGEKYYIYDIMELDGKNLRDLSVVERLEILYNLPIKHLVIPTYYKPKEKKSAFQKLKEILKEGVVFKKSNSKYVPGKPASKSSQIKFRFFTTSTFYVIKHSKKARSVEVGVYDNNKLVPLGNVTIYPNFDMPDVGTFVEVKYAHCFTGGKLYHTIYQGPRTDQDINDCTMSQIKFKPKDDDE